MCDKLAPPTTYRYDVLDRLIREQGPAVTQSFGYDGGGNRTSDGTGSYVYAPSSNRQTSRPQGPVTLDGAGHTTAQAGFTYTWDGAGRLKTVRLSGTLLATYHYDAGHRRTRKETTAQAPQGAATVLYGYDPDDHLIAESDSSGPIRSYVWRDDVPLAQIEHRPTRKVLYFETDHLNTPRGARNEAGVRVWRWEADAFGSSLPDQDPDGDGQATTVNLRYPGQYFDPESGLHYNQARYYDPTSGRYLSPDPIGLVGGLNPYLYANANPLRFTDPSGLFPFLVIPGVCAAGGCEAVAAAFGLGAYMSTPAGRDAARRAADTINKACDEGNDKKCEQQLEREEALCEAIARPRYPGNPAQAVTICKKAAFQRYAQCLRGVPESERQPLTGVETPI